MPSQPPRKQYNVAVVGATGVVGLEFLKIAAERRFPLKGLKLLATERSAGKRIPFGEGQITVEATTHDSFKSADFVFISASGAASREYAPIARDAGAIVIDDSSVWRQDPDVPLVAPEVNADDVAWHKGILAIPNCSTTPLVLCLWPLHKLNRVTRVIADTYQSVSGTGTSAVGELDTQTKNWAQGRPESIPHVYPHQIAFNLLPHIDSFMDSGYTKEEWKMMAETRKIMHEPDLPLSATCVRVPVFYSHSLAVHAEFERPWSAGEVREILREAPGVVVQDEPSVNLYPTPRDAAGKDPVFVGRIREDMSNPNGIAMWISSDNIRKGAALNAIQIAEEMVKRSLV
ncbi:MAG TPA: aspartate-semialdehyde dehydrogenase [Dehalococcoidia bacterium]|nr:aspartate-semialdehyde dehydrogenase [Dehalococcoidia bacterium]